MKRRSFLKVSGGTVVALGSGSACLHSCKMITGVSDTPEAPTEAVELTGRMLRIDLDKVKILQETGTSIKLARDIGGEKKKFIVVHTAENEFLAFADHCSHGGRELEYFPDKSMMRCTSFGHSKYDLKGQVIGGPAPDPLETFPVRHIDHLLEFEV